MACVLLLSTASAGTAIPRHRWGDRRPQKGGTSLSQPHPLPLSGKVAEPSPFSMNYILSPVLRDCASSLATNGGRKGLSPGEGCSDSRLQGLGAEECPLITLPLLPAGRSSGTYRVSWVPWFPTVSSITHRALNDKDNSKYGLSDLGLAGHTLCRAHSNLTPAQPPPPHTAGVWAPPWPWSRGWNLGEPYPISRWPGGPLSLAILTLLPLWIQKQL